MPRRPKNRLPKTRSKEEWDAFFRVINTRYPTAARNHALLYLTYVTGMRIGEALDKLLERMPEPVRFCPHRPQDLVGFPRPLR